MNIQDFIREFVDKKITNTKINPNAVDDFIKSKLKIRTYIPFMEKRTIVELVVSANMTEENGIKKIDSVGQFVGFVVSMLMAHTNLEFGESDAIQSYDALSEVGLIEPIIACFQKDYTECEVLLKMTVADMLEDNNANVLIGHFLDAILKKVKGLSDVLNGAFGGIDLNEMFKEENVAKILGLLNK